jgi:RNA polymerase sigma-70 factor (ECF subfamily)
MAQDKSFVDLMARLRAGDDVAATEVFNRFAHRLIALARSRLDQLLQGKVDPEDVLQSVYKSFFIRQAQGRCDLDSWDSLWGMLTIMTLRKCGHRRDYFQAACRDAHREVRLPPAAGTSGVEWELLAHDPTPSEATRLAETVEQVMRDLTGRERDIFTLSLQGYSTTEISARVGRTERTVERVLKRVKKCLEEMDAAV